MQHWMASDPECTNSLRSSKFIHCKISQMPNGLYDRVFVALFLRRNTVKYSCV